MISHIIPLTESTLQSLVRPDQGSSRVEAAPLGSFPFPVHPSFRRQGTNFHSGPFPTGPGEGRVRGRLRLSVARRPRSRLRWPPSSGRNRLAACDDAGVFTRKRRSGDRPHGDERNSSNGRGWPGVAGRAAEGVAGPARGSDVRRAGTQVPDLGAVPLRRLFRGGAHPPDAPAGRTRRQFVGMSQPSRHVAVLLAEVLEALQPLQGALIVDGTFGAGGYTKAILDRGASVVALDRDPAAIRGGAGLVAASEGRLRLVEARFGDLCAVAQTLGLEKADGVVFDIGVSSMQLDEAERGFSLRFDAPLDMRMSRTGRTAADILRDEDENTIADILFRFGEERASRRIARAIVADRETSPFVSTLELARMIARVAPARRGELTHPATRTFQALRIAVNDELGELLRGLAAAERLLAPGGRLAVVTFHSLEDRIVKQFLASRSGRGRAASRLLPGEPTQAEPTFEVPRGQPIEPGEAEIAANPRSRSAKLRFAVRLDASARAGDEALGALTRLPARRGRQG